MQTFRTCHGNPDENKSCSSMSLLLDFVQTSCYIFWIHIKTYLGFSFRASERYFTRGYEDQCWIPLASGALVESCIAHLYSNQNIKTATTLRFRNLLIVIMTTGFWAWLQKHLACVISSPGPKYLAIPGSMYLLYPSGRSCFHSNIIFCQYDVVTIVKTL